MRKSIPVLVCAAAAAAFSLSAAARGPGGGSFGGGGFSHGSPIGPSNGQAMENSNGRFSSDRETGLDRAKERMDEHALDHEKASDAQKKRSQNGESRLRR